jgi:hypothetical protein
LLSSDLERSAGSLEVDFIRRAPAVIFGHIEHSHMLDAQAAEGFVATQLGLVEGFLLALWLLKDNAVNVELGLLQQYDSQSLQVRISSNRRAVRFSDAAGSFAAVDYTESELRQGRDLFSRLFAGRMVDPHSESGGHLIPDRFSRLDRMLYFVQAARSTSNLGVKVAEYVTGFEALFCTDATEIAHKLSERLAWFCGAGPQGRFEVFRTAKAAYTIRSKTVHGDKLSAKQASNVGGISKACDDFIRRALVRIATTPGMHERFLGPSEKLEEYLTRTVFGLEDDRVATYPALAADDATHRR